MLREVSAKLAQRLLEAGEIGILLDERLEEQLDERRDVPIALAAGREQSRRHCSEDRCGFIVVWEVGVEMTCEESILANWRKLGM